jgi:hypothetical protein
LNEAPWSLLWFEVAWVCLLSARAISRGIVKATAAISANHAGYRHGDFFPLGPLHDDVNVVRTIVEEATSFVF